MSTRLTPCSSKQLIERVVVIGSTDPKVGSVGIVVSKTGL